MLDHITPVLLTYNEAPNIARTLSHLEWAKDIVVVDSGSTDDTVAMLGRASKVRVFGRPLDTLANQWRYAVTDTAIATPWILRLDADYQLTDEFIEELRQLLESRINDFTGEVATFFGIESAVTGGLLDYSVIGHNSYVSN